MLKIFQGDKSFQVKNSATGEAAKNTIFSSKTNLRAFFGDKDARESVRMRKRNAMDFCVREISKLFPDVSPDRILNAVWGKPKNGVRPHNGISQNRFDRILVTLSRDFTSRDTLQEHVEGLIAKKRVALVEGE